MSLYDFGLDMLKYKRVFSDMQLGLRFLCKDAYLSSFIRNVSNMPGNLYEM